MDQQTRQALKRQDGYTVAGEHGLEWAQENRKPLIVAATVVLLVIVLAVIAGVVYRNRSEQASSAFGAAMQTYQTPLAAPGQQVPPGLKTFPSVPERAKVATAQFEAVAHQYGMTPDGKNALYFAGLTQMEAGQNASAEATLKKVADGWNRELGSLARLALAQLYQQTGRGAQAVETLQALAGKPTISVPAGTAKLQLATLYESEGKADQARRIYAELKDKDPKGQAGLIAAQRLNPGERSPVGPQS